jgi:propionate CoA-transferase
VPEELLAALEARFVETGQPRDLTLVFAAGQGDGKERGLNRLGHDGLLRRVVGGHWGLIPKVGRLALENRIEAYNLPQGVISQLFREIAGGRPGVFTKVGRGTFVDPDQGGGRINAITAEDLVRHWEIDGEPWLFYKAFPIHVALLRGTTADENGNLSMEREALSLDNLAMAMAARNSGGVVIAQVERVCGRGAGDPKRVVVPGALVDAVVIAEPQNHWQTYATPYSPYFSGELRAPEKADAPMALDARKIIARRCALELPQGGVVNLGIGMPEGVAAVAAEELILDTVTLTAEPGVLGGRPAGGLDFGAAVNTEAVIAQNSQFDFYDGGGLDMACLGMAELDGKGDVNVSRFGSRLAGAGGFINISQNARKIVFAGTFTAGGLDVACEDGLLVITSEGRAPKCVAAVGQVTFSAAEAMRRGRKVRYVTERCVFKLSAAGVELVEIAPGVDIDRDILAHMAFRPLIRDVKTMKPEIFREGRMGLAEGLSDLKLDERVQLDAAGKSLFLDFESMRVRSLSDIAAIRDAVEAALAGMRDRVEVFVNYTRFEIEPEMVAPYAEMVRELEGRLYGHVSRYAAHAFHRMQVERIFGGTG